MGILDIIRRRVVNPALNYLSRSLPRRIPQVLSRKPTRIPPDLTLQQLTPRLGAGGIVPGQPLVPIPKSLIPKPAPPLKLPPTTKTGLVTPIPTGLKPTKQPSFFGIPGEKVVPESVTKRLRFLFMPQTMPEEERRAIGKGLDPSRKVLSLAKDRKKLTEKEREEQEQTLLNIAFFGMGGFTKTGDKLLEEAAKRLRIPTPILAEQIQKGVSPVIKSLGRQFAKREAAELTTPRLAPEKVGAVIEAATRRIQQDPTNPIVKDQSKRLFRRIADQYEAGELYPENIPRILEQNGMSPTEFATIFKDTITTGARDLNKLSQLAKKINAILPEAELPVKPQGPWDMFKNVYRNVDNFRRAILVSQWATAARNAISQSGRYTLNMVDDALTGTMELGFGKRGPRQAYAPLMEDIHAIFRRMSPDARKQLGSILDSDELLKNKLFNKPVGDVALTNRVAKFFNIFNTTQEYFFRKMAVDSKLRSNIIREGFDPDNMANVPANVFKRSFSNAVPHALDITFARTPEQGAGAAVMNMYREMPFLTALGNPFPRFWTNAVKFLMDFSPGGFVRLLNPKFRQQLASPNSTKAMQAMSRATLGTMMWGAGYAIRDSQFAGDKWYEIKAGDKTIDTRPFAPFSTYLFIGQALKDPTKLSGFDWADAAISINRIAGTGLVFVDLLRGRSIEDMQGILADFAGQYIGGFSTGFRTYSDILGQFRPEAAKIRTTREQPLTAPFQANIPFLGERLPELPRITRGEPYRRESPLLRQFTGLTVKTKTYLESEIDRLRLEMKDIVPKTGDKRINRFISANTGVLMGQLTPLLEKSSAYQQAGDYDKKLFIKELFSEQKGIAREAVLTVMAEELANQYIEDLKKLDTFDQQREYLTEKKNKGLLIDPIAEIILQRSK